MDVSYLPTATVIPIKEVGRAKRKVRSAPKGRAVDAKALAEVRALLGDSPRRGDLLIEFLHRIQDTFDHIGAAHIVALAQEMKLAMTEVYEVATFYHHFDVVKEGENAPPALTVRVCETLSCAMAGSGELLRDLHQRLGRGVRVIPAPCIGRCDGALAATVGRHAIDRATVETIEAAVEARTLEAPVADYATYLDYRSSGGYALLADCVAGKRGADDVFATLESSLLRGLGGAGFPAGRKWKIVRAAPAPRLMAVNIDEGEPGTFKDRVYLERDPHRFLEGMLIAAWAVGIDAIYIYLRDEYAGCREILTRELAALAAAPPCPLPTIELRRGAGAYICGEESAMIESIEGKRGTPRLRPPYVAQVGLFGRPTLEHNMETLYWVRDILENGAGWFSGHGRRGRKGLRSFSVSGRVARPGVHLAPAGIIARELIDEYAGGMLPGHELYAYLPGGASGGILPASLADIPLDFDTLQPYDCFIGSAAVIVLSQRDRARDAALNMMQFFADESCGQCTPCRVGTEKAVDLLRQPTWDTALLEQLSYPMVLITGRQLEHWHTGSMTRRSAVLDAIEPDPVASLNLLDLTLLGVKPGDVITVESRRGSVSLYARADEGTPQGAVFIPFCYYEAAANVLTNPALDPFAKIPEFKYCAVKITPGGQVSAHSSFGGGRLLAPVEA